MQFWPAVYFAATYVPLGTILDLAGRKNRGKKYDLRKTKYYILIFVLVSSLFTLNLVHLFDPISFITRVYTFFNISFCVFFTEFGLWTLSGLLLNIFTG